MGLDPFEWLQLPLLTRVAPSPKSWAHAWDPGTAPANDAVWTRFLHVAGGRTRVELILRIMMGPRGLEQPSLALTWLSVNQPTATYQTVMMAPVRRCDGFVRQTMRQSLCSTRPGQTVARDRLSTPS